MSKGITISLPKAEQDKFRAWVRQQTADTKRECKRIVEDNIQKFHADVFTGARFSGPYTQGGIRLSTHMTWSGDRLGGMVYVDKRYAPYVEFGTGRYVSVPAGYEAFARQFKGRGIRNNNMRPQPFFVHNYEKAKKNFIKDLNKLGFR